MFLLTLSDGPSPVTTPFEDWCASIELHPDDSRAWPLYEVSVAAADHTPAAS